MTLGLLSTLPTNFLPIEMKFSACCASRRRISGKVRYYKYKCRTVLLPRGFLLARLRSEKWWYYDTV
eukprot:COSAG03_NODE_583_length_6860_cov_9.293300_5_plen_67_part_00